MTNPLPKRITVNVTKNHIDNGRRNDCSECPIALAIIDQLKWTHQDINIEVRTGHIKIKKRNQSYFYNLSMAFYDFVNRFDSGDTVTPLKSHIILHSIEA